MASTRLLLVLGLQRTGELFVGLISNDREAIDERVMNSPAMLVHWETEPPANLLSLSLRGLGIVESADLKDVRVVPSLSKRRVTEEHRLAIKSLRSLCHENSFTGHGPASCWTHVDQGLASIHRLVSGVWVGASTKKSCTVVFRAADRSDVIVCDECTNPASTH